MADPLTLGVIVALGPAYVMAYAMAGKVTMNLMSSATETAVTETIPGTLPTSKP